MSVVHLFEAEAPGRCGEDPGARARLIEEFLEPAEISFPTSNFEEGADHAANLVAEEAVTPKLQSKTCAREYGLG